MTKVFGPLDDFSGFYPERPGLLHHELGNHPLLDREALRRFANRLPASDVEYNRGDLPVSVAESMNIGNGLSIRHTLEEIDRNGSWMVLKSVGQDAQYAQLLAEVLDDIASEVVAATGSMLKTEGFVFISSPASVTPFHFDPEHNILMQIAGTKMVTVFPPGDPEIVPDIEHERYHLGGHRNVPLASGIAHKGRVFTLAPGDALYIPVKAPHWVRNGPETSVSLSVTWRSGWSYAEADARGLNAMLRRLGLKPAAPNRWPHRNLAKATARRLLRRLLH